jgi:PAS domain S-box-containing protein
MHDANPELTGEVMSAMLAASPDCVKILSADGEILYVNARGAELMRLDSVDAIVGLAYLDLWPEQDRERIERAVKQAASGQTVRFEACCHNAKHDLMCWEVSLAPFHVAGKPTQIVGISRDISEHRQSKIALSLSEDERLQAELRHQALSELSTKLFDLDDTSDLAYASAEILGRTLNVSRAGYGTIDPIAETITIERDWNAPGIHTLAGTLRFRDYGSYIDDLKRGETVVFADAYKDPRTAANADKLTAISAQSAVNMPITEQSGFVAIIYTNHESVREWSNAELIFMRDVANRTRVAIERRRAEQDLRAIAASLEQQVAARTIERDRIWRLSIDLILIVQMDARIVATNPAWTRTLGWQEDELIGSNLLDLLHPDDVESTRSEVARMSDGHVAIQFENRYRRRDGSYCWISWNAFPNDGLIHAVGRDVGSEKEHAHALALAQEQLRQAQKMEAIGKLTGGIAHDFNNLLQVISGNLQLLSNDVAGNERAERRVVNAMAGVSRGSKLASQLLAFGRRQPLAPKVVNLGRLIRDLDDLLRRALGEAIEIETIAAGGLWNTLIDPANVENALLNLAINARDAMDGRGRLTIEAGNASLDDHYVQINPDAIPGQYVMLAVSDTGCGIPDNIIGQVFEPFFTTKPEGHGTGLGLSMVYGFVKQSGGHIKVYSEPGQGTTIKLYLPRSVQTEDVIIDHDSGVVTGGTENILVAEDDDAVRDTVVALLADLGYRVLKARDAQGALTIIESGVPIDLLFTDVVMPGPLKSPEVARKARERLPHLAVLFTSGYTENSIVHGGRLDEGVDLLTKPYTREALAKKLRQVLAAQAQRNEKAVLEIESSPVVPSVAQRAASAPKRSILVCEDDWMIRVSIVDILEAKGYAVIESGDAAQAISAFNEHSVDLLLTDVGLPDMSGVDLVKALREKQPRLPVIFATGNDTVSGIDLDAQTCILQKPYGSDALHQLIVQCFEAKPA